MNVAGRRPQRRRHPRSRSRRDRAPRRRPQPGRQQPMGPGRSRAASTRATARVPMATVASLRKSGWGGSPPKVTTRRDGGAIRRAAPADGDEAPGSRPHVARRARRRRCAPARGPRRSRSAQSTAVHTSGSWKRPSTPMMAPAAMMPRRRPSALPPRPATRRQPPATTTAERPASSLKGMAGRPSWMTVANAVASSARRPASAAATLGTRAASADIDRGAAATRGPARAARPRHARGAGSASGAP